MSSSRNPSDASAATTLLARQQEALFASGATMRQLLDLLPQPLLIINRSWKVVYANSAVLGMFDLGGRLRPAGLCAGEAFHCRHARRATTDPAASEACQVCGVARSVTLALQGRETVSDCRLVCDLAGNGAPLELRVWATPLTAQGERFSMLALSDIGPEKRRAMLANVCFHDLLNTLTGIRGLLDVLKHTDVAELPEICELLEETTLGSIEEITTLRLLEQAEESTLTVNREPLTTAPFLQQMLKTLRRHPQARGKCLRLEGEAANVTLCTDGNLLRRVVGNMILNALEATGPGGEVTLGCRCCGTAVEFSVHNPSSIPLDSPAPFRPKATAGALAPTASSCSVPCSGGRRISIPRRRPGRPSVRPSPWRRPAESGSG